ncbi:hypothetical protein IW150_003730, partial [Coemansia sp. RSA 2607]
HSTSNVSDSATATLPSQETVVGQRALLDAESTALDIQEVPECGKANISYPRTPSCKDSEKHRPIDVAIDVGTEVSSNANAATKHSRSNGAHEEAMHDSASSIVREIEHPVAASVSGSDTVSEHRNNDGQNEEGWWYNMREGFRRLTPFQKLKVVIMVTFAYIQ